MFNSYKNKISRFLSDTYGVAAILGAILLPTMIGGTGLAVDGTRYLRAKNVIIAAADSAALAATSVDLVKGGETREQIAAKFFKANIPSDYANVVTLKGFNFSDNSQRGGSIVVDYTIDASIKTILGSVVGVDTIDVLHKGQAVREISNLEVVLAMPVNGTMCSHKDKPTGKLPEVRNDTVIKLNPDKNCNHFNLMLEGAKSFTDIMFANQTVQRLKIGIVPYNFKVRMPDTRLIPTLMRQNEAAEPKFFENVEDAAPLPPILPLTTDKTKVDQFYRNVKQTEQGIAWARSNIGTLVSALMLDPSQTQFFKGGVAPAALNDPSVSKIMILMADGSIIGCCFTN